MFKFVYIKYFRNIDIYCCSCSLFMINAILGIEYGSSSWDRSTHVKKVDIALNDTCRLITGCFRPSKTKLLYLVPPYIRRNIISTIERTKVDTDPCHPMFGQITVHERLKSPKILYA